MSDNIYTSITDDVEANVTAQLKLFNEYGIIDISTVNDVDTIFEFADSMIKPLLYAMGYHDASVKELFGEEEKVSVPSVWSAPNLNDPEPYTVTTWNTEDTIGVGTEYMSSESASYAEAGKQWVLRQVNGLPMVNDYNSEVGLYPSFLDEDDTNVSYGGTYEVNDINNITEDELKLIFDNDKADFVRLAV